MTIHTISLKEAMLSALNTLPAFEKEDPDPMDWEWTSEPLPVPSLAIDFDEKIKKGKTKLTLAEDPEDAADQAARSRRGGIVPPPTPQGSLGDRKSVV